jgi:hypothetical protein
MEAGAERVSHGSGGEIVSWWSVRCVFRDGTSYEERVTLWSADDVERAIRRAEAEAVEYAGAVDVEYLGFAQAYRLPEDPAEGVEVFSLIRESTLEPAEYLDAFFDTGAEFQR